MNDLKCSCATNCGRELKVCPGEMYRGATLILEKENDITGVGDVLGTCHLSQHQVDLLIAKLKPFGTNP